MSRLSVAVAEYFKDPKHVVREVEERAKLPRMTIGTIIKDFRPRLDRFCQLVGAVDDDTAINWVEAYLLDAVPEGWHDRVRVLIKEGAQSIVSEGGLKPELGFDFDRAWLRLRAVMLRDTELGAWFVQTVSLVLGEGSTQSPADEHGEGLSFDIVTVDDEGQPPNSRAAG